MERDNWLLRVGQIRRWTRGGERAPHKPLLLLYAIGRLQHHGSSAVPFAEAEPVLQHLQTDGLWVVTTRDGTSAGSAVGKLRAGAVGAVGAVGAMAIWRRRRSRRRPPPPAQHCWNCGEPYEGDTCPYCGATV